MNVSQCLVLTMCVWGCVFTSTGPSHLTLGEPIVRYANESRHLDGEEGGMATACTGNLSLFLTLFPDEYKYMDAMREYMFLFASTLDCM